MPKKQDKRIGNQFWKLRSKHGRDSLFKSPKKLWEAASEYFEWCDQNPWIREETTTKPHGAEHKKIPTARPYTLTGLCIYLDVNNRYFFEFKNSETCKNSKDFSTIVTRIEEIIYTQKFEGAAVGAFNANIIARDLGLRDNQDIDIKSDGRSIAPTVIAQSKEQQKRIDDLLKNFDDE